jgi:hypothetical protein
LPEGGSVFYLREGVFDEKTDENVFIKGWITISVYY